MPTRVTTREQITGLNFPRVSESPQMVDLPVSLRSYMSAATFDTSFYGESVATAVERPKKDLLPPDVWEISEENCLSHKPGDYTAGDIRGIIETLSKVISSHTIRINIFRKRIEALKMELERRKSLIQVEKKEDRKLLESTI